MGWVKIQKCSLLTCWLIHSRLCGPCLLNRMISAITSLCGNIAKTLVKVDHRCCHCLSCANPGVFNLLIYLEPKKSLDWTCLPMNNGSTTTPKRKRHPFGFRGSHTRSCVRHMFIYLFLDIFRVYVVCACELLQCLCQFLDMLIISESDYADHNPQFLEKLHLQSVWL